MDAGVFPYPPIKLEGKKGKKVDRQKHRQITDDIIQMHAPGDIVHTQI